jgi:hypothetical protein
MQAIKNPKLIGIKDAIAMPTIKPIESCKSIILDENFFLLISLEGHA